MAFPKESWGQSKVPILHKDSHVINKKALPASIVNTEDCHPA